MAKNLILQQAAGLIRAINHDLRIRMIETIGKGQLTVTEIYVKMRLEQSVASQHLKILRDADVVKTKRDGKFILYSVDYARLNEINEWAKQIKKK